jgi:hypothetical protein
MNPVPGANITGSRDPAEVIRQGFRVWSSIPTAIIAFAEGTPIANKVAYDGKNVVVTNLTASEWAAFGVSSAVLAFTTVNWSDGGAVSDKLGQPVGFPGQIMDADIVFNPSYQFSTDSDNITSDKLDFQAVITHEIGHFLGLDHTPMVSSTMFWSTTGGTSRQRTLTTDDIAGVSSLYPSASFLSTGTLKGTVRTTANVPVFGAVVIAINSQGQSVAGVLTEPNGQYSIMGLDPGDYTVYAQTLDVFTISQNFRTLSIAYPSSTVTTGFTGRFR